MSDYTPTLPPAVARIAEQADDIHRQMYTTTSDAPPATTASDAPPTSVSTEPPVTTPNWEHMYKSLKGRYDAELPRLNEQVTTLLGESAALRQLLANMQVDEPKPANNTPAPVVIPAEMRLTPEETESYGSDMINVIKKVANERAFEMTADLRNQLQDLAQKFNSVNSTVANSARDRMIEHLNANQPDWEVQNKDPGFHEWLRQTDRYAGMQRGIMLNDAWEKNEAQRVLNFFQDYRKELAAVTPPEGSPTAAVPSLIPNQGAPPTVDLNQLVAPGRPSNGQLPPSSTPDAQQTFTKAQVNQFFKDLTLGKFAGREAEAQRIEIAIHQAGQAGRIR